MDPVEKVARALDLILAGHIGADTPAEVALDAWGEEAKALIEEFPQLALEGQERKHRSFSDSFARGKWKRTFGEITHRSIVWESPREPAA